MKKKPYHYLFKLSSFINRINENDDTNLELSEKKILNLSKKFRDIIELNSYNLTHEEVMIIAVAWQEYIIGRKFGIDPMDVLGKLYNNPSTKIGKLDIIIKLLKKNVFYTSRKEILIKKYGFEKENTILKFSKSSLLENNIEFHRNFLNLLLLGKKTDIAVNNAKPYSDNKEFLDDWFSYVRKVYEFSLNGLSNRGLHNKLDEMETNNFLEVLEWQDRIMKRMKSTKEIFPLIDMKNEFSLDDKEVLIIVHLIKEELEDNNCDTDELVKLISSDYHEMYQNQEYISENSKLVKKGLIELSEGVFFLSKGTNVRVAPDIVRRVIMKTPINDDDRLKQILGSDDIFTLIEPTQCFCDLILPMEIKDTINFSLNQYRSNVDSILSRWGLYNKGLKLATDGGKKLESGMLMLFYGEPGTGKTFAAGAIAQSLGKKLLITDISRIQSKWVGDSEKNVRKIFSIFERIVHRVENPPILLLNEADQFLIRRSDIANSSVDKMMNSMQNLFLEAFENLNGILIATTNLISNLDDAFSRRFHLKLEFPMPQAPERKKLWSLHLPNTIPGSEKIDFNYLSDHYILSGGQIKVVIKNACVEAASRKGYSQRLLQKDLIKYCDLENMSNFGARNKLIGF